MQDLHAARVIGEGAHGEGGSDGGKGSFGLRAGLRIGAGWIHCVWGRVCGCEVGHFEIDGDLLERPDAHLAPASGGHGFDQGDFRASGRAKLADKRGEVLLKAVLGFAVDGDGRGEEAVGDGVAGRKRVCLRA